MSWCWTHHYTCGGAHRPLFCEIKAVSIMNISKDEIQAYGVKKLDVDPLKGSRNESQIKKFNKKLKENWKANGVDKLLQHAKVNGSRVLLDSAMTAVTASFVGEEGRGDLDLSQPLVARPDGAPGLAERGALRRGRKDVDVGRPCAGRPVQRQDSGGPGRVVISGPESARNFIYARARASEERAPHLCGGNPTWVGLKWPC